MLEEIVIAISFGLIPVIIFLVLLYSFHLIRAPVYLKFEKIMKPCLQVIQIKNQQCSTGSVENDWVLEIKNIGIETAEECHAHLEQITTEFSSRRLSDFPTDRDLHWSGWAEGIEDFKIPGQQSAKLGLIYNGSDKPDRITLAYRADKNFRLAHDLSLYEEPILLLLNIKSKNILPLYVVIRIDLEEMVKNLVIQPKDKPICEILWVGTQKRDLSEFTKISNPNIQS